jgi:plasmid maintenance system antidote protein VapI
MPKKANRLPPVHPGEILREDLLKPLGISINRLGRELRVPVTRMTEIVNGRRGVTADKAPSSRVNCGKCMPFDHARLERATTGS